MQFTWFCILDHFKRNETTDNSSLGFQWCFSEIPRAKSDEPDIDALIDGKSAAARRETSKGGCYPSCSNALWASTVRSALDGREIAITPSDSGFQITLPVLEEGAVLLLD